MEKIDTKNTVRQSALCEMKSEGRKEELLIVDDDPAWRRLLTRMLSSAGYTCRESTDGTEALELIHQGSFSLVLVDFKMPRLDGAQMLKQLRSDPDPAIAQIPAIVMTGHGETEILCLELGANDFVAKPINFAVLRARIETQLRLRSLRMELQKQNEESETWRRNFERDLAAARLTQQSLIPQKPPTIPFERGTAQLPEAQLGSSTPNCFAYSAFKRCQPPNFIVSGPTRRPMGRPARCRSSTSKQMCQPAAPIEM